MAEDVLRIIDCSLTNPCLNTPVGINSSSND